MNLPLTLKLLAYGVAIAALGGVFALYTSPTILVSLAEQLWACFN
ncbi:MAG TPA: hypothetical protein VLJ86_14930 [Ramlibacter sp.]|nr:hypothetical protein [Ramlibacter sp.]